MLPIGPIWNWNITSTSTRWMGWLLPIGPIWNWNLLITSWAVGALTLPIGPIWNWNWYTETVRDKLLYPCQSDQSGIETVCDHSPSPIHETANRTNLELKLSFESSSSSPIILPIGPIWNWNCSSRCSQKLLRFLPIGPIWNWNEDLSIEDINPVFCQSDQSGIETCLVGKFLLCRFAANRTNLELKRSYLHLSTTRSGLPIGPIWNWNMWWRLESMILACCQSDQSGIETRQLPEPVFCQFAANRTNLELKP